MDETLEPNTESAKAFHDLMFNIFRVNENENTMF